MSATNRTFGDFYRFYLTEHSKRTTKILHFVGTLLVLTVLAIALWTANWWFLVWIPIFGYGFAWIGHFFFERNKPASFSRTALQSRCGFRDVQRHSHGKGAIVAEAAPCVPV